MYGTPCNLDGYVIESVRRRTVPLRETGLGSNGKVWIEKRRDTRREITIVLRGDIEPAATGFVYGEETFIVDSVEDEGTYNGKKRFTVQAHHHENCNTETL